MSTTTLLKSPPQNPSISSTTSTSYLHFSATQTDQDNMKSIKPRTFLRKLKFLPTITSPLKQQPPPKPDLIEEEQLPSLSDFEEKCPPGGKDSVILYITSLRSIRKTFEDCHAIRFLLESFKVRFFERDVSMHLEFREELWRILGGRVIPPRLFIRGRYIGGADEVVGLNEQGKLKKLLEGIPILPATFPCASCGNLRFVVCCNCNGSRKVFGEGENCEIFIRCCVCNENGLVKCPVCS